ncbi:MAG TPA: multicopper oxidase family protein [Solirubrobacterales bacterium]|nr:multicopper oxidase family protein [Solirubrobacterales bacterium]
MPFWAQLPIPPELTEAGIRIPIRAAELQILPGRKTKLWTYGGSFPGPTVRRWAGQRTRVTFEHQLPAAAGELSVHLHGGHNRTQFDGQPGGLTKSQPASWYCQIPRGLSARESGNDLLLAPGQRKTYVYDLREAGEPERAAFQWYHDHRLDRTAEHTWKGLAGMWIVDDEFDASLPLPRGERDVALMIGDRSFDRHNQLTDPYRRELRPPADGIVGDRILVNGAFMPHHRVGARRYRLRILNVSQFLSYNLQLSNGAPMVQIATDSGLMPQPVRRTEIMLGPAERAEVIVDFAPMRGESVELRSAKRHPGRNSDGAHTYGGALMQFRVGSERLADRTRVPRKLRPLPEWTRKVSRKPDHRWVITVGGLFKTTWEINGRTFNPAYAEARVELGSTVTWEFHNRTSVAHVMHLHHTDWYLLEREGREPPPWENCLKDTFFVFPNEKILLAGHFSDYTGKFVVHCHMLDHEDHGLMSQFQVVEN